MVSAAEFSVLGLSMRAEPASPRRLSPRSSGSSETPWPFGREVCKPRAFPAKACWCPGSACEGRERGVCRAAGSDPHPWPRGGRWKGRCSG